MNGTRRTDIKPGLEVAIVLKQDQRTGALTRGRVQAILTRSPTHPHGIKVRLENGAVGRVKEVLPAPGPEPKAKTTGIGA
jgi:uncharacterized repeat protein (TIGR03833 family)